KKQWHSLRPQHLLGFRKKSRNKYPDPDRLRSHHEDLLPEDCLSLPNQIRQYRHREVNCRKQQKARTAQWQWQLPEQSAQNSSARLHNNPSQEYKYKHKYSNGLKAYRLSPDFDGTHILKQDLFMSRHLPKINSTLPNSSREANLLKSQESYRLNQKSLNRPYQSHKAYTE